MSLIDCKFHLEKLFAKSPQNGWPHGNLTIITHSSKQDDSVKAANSGSEFFGPFWKVYANFLSISIHTNLVRFAGLPQI
jgi:hypothetical protein